MPKSKKIRVLVSLILLSALVLIGLNLTRQWLKRISFMPIEVVVLTDKLQHADPAVIKAAVKKHVAVGFFDLEVAAISAELKQIPWVSAANVQRCWPNMVKIKVFERQPLATWQGRGVVDTEGKLFLPVNIAGLEAYPEFVGRQEQIDAMVDKYLLILSALKPIGLAVKKLEIMPDQGWRAMLDNGVTIVLGQEEIDQRLTRFVLAYPIVAAKPNKVTIVDLRYTNGLSVV